MLYTYDHGFDILSGKISEIGNNVYELREFRTNRHTLQEEIALVQGLTRS